MAITHIVGAIEPSASTTSYALQYNVTTGFTTQPSVGDLVVVAIARASTAALTVPSGWALASSVSANSTSCNICWRVWREGDESLSWTWSWTGASRMSATFRVFHDSLYPSTWSLDKTATNSGTGTSSTSGSTGSLSAAVEVAFTLFAANGDITAPVAPIAPWIASGSTVADAGTGRAITAATTALNPGFSWTTSRGWSANIATFLPTPDTGNMLLAF